MTESGRYQIITFYEFKQLSEVADLPTLKESIKEIMRRTGVRGTVLLASEGFNSTVCGTPAQIEEFVPAVERLLDTNLDLKSSYHESAPLRKIDVKIRPEIVTLKKNVEIGRGAGTHVPAKEWNTIISDGGTLVLDARNDYEYRNGTFRGAINPGVTRFSDLPAFVAENLDPYKHKRVAMFCTGGIRCEKFAAYMKQAGFETVFQLEGGILRYLEEIPQGDSLWTGECFVFDERVTVDHDLVKGVGPDHSLRGRKGSR
jgi:UPF0176 protein